jgi:L-fuconolactonase
MTRRTLLTTLSAGLAASPSVLAAGRPSGPIVDTHVHLFAADQKRFPFAPNAPYKPEPLTLEDYVTFAKAAGLDHAVIVHPEPYQDDYRYLEYSFAHEHVRGFFKGTCLFDPVAKDTPDRIAALVGQNPGRIVALRIHQTRKPGLPPTSMGALKDRDMRAPEMKATWKRCQQLGLAIQMHFHPFYATQILELVEQLPDVTVVLDHLGRVAEGTPAELANVLKLAKHPKVVMKYSNAKAEMKPLVRKIYDAFGPNRLIWGYFGHDLPGYQKEADLLEAMFDYATEDDRGKIRGGNAIKLYKW